MEYCSAAATDQVSAVVIDVDSATLGQNMVVELVDLLVKPGQGLHGISPDPQVNHCPDNVIIKVPTRLSQTDMVAHDDRSDILDPDRCIALGCDNRVFQLHGILVKPNGPDNIHLIAVGDEIPARVGVVGAQVLGDLGDGQSQGFHPWNVNFYFNRPGGSPKSLHI